MKVQVQLKGQLDKMWRERENERERERQRERERERERDILGKHHLLAGTSTYQQPESLDFVD